MSSRTYLSIGDVLTLLREEFPDVTISKIRFLESQGLVNPERSPSGYRKFFEADVERLRWVLRQQREHFLPLKVIRDRLSEGDLDATPGEESGGVGAVSEPGPDDDIMGEVPQPARRNGKVREPAHAAHAPVPSAAGSPQAPGRSSDSGAGAGGQGGTWSGTAGASRTEEQMAKADDEAMARILADATRRAARLPESGGERSPLRVVPGDAAKEADVTPPGAASTSTAPATPGRDQVRPGPPDRRAGSAGGGGHLEPDHEPDHDHDRTGGPSGPAPASAPSGRPSEPGRMRASAPGAGAPHRQSPTGTGRGAGTQTSVMTSGMVTGASLTTDELCAATGLSEVELAALEGFGLLESEMVAGITTFNEDALTVANLAAEFRKFGIEPRHLRLYRNAVDRELGLIEQVIIPLLRQRNPESRQRAVESATELGSLGQTMRAALLRAALRRHLGG